VKHIIFDFDGTLFNSAEGIYQSFKIAAEAISLPPPRKSEFLSAIGPPIHQLIPMIYHNLSSDQSRSLCAFFRQHYDSIGCLNSWPYDGILELLHALDEDEKIQKISVVTNKPTLPTIKLLIKNHFHKYFDNIIGIDYPAFFNQGTTYSSKVQALNDLLKPFTFSNIEPIYIGDAASDLDTARSASCRFVAVNYGFYSWPESSRLLHAVADTPHQLQSLIAETN
jgi:phosphoglycolate phosphatase